MPSQPPLHPCPYRRPTLVANISFLLLFLGSNCIAAFAPPTPSSPHASIFGNHVMKTNSAEPITKLFLGSDFGNGNIHREDEDDTSSRMSTPPKDSTPPLALWAALTGSGPPLKIDDTQLVLYDVFLITNLSVSLSYLVVHRMDFSYVPSSLNEGALLSICWIIAGLGNGAFLHSAVDGHYDMLSSEYEEKGGPKAAGLLAVSTFIGTSSLRIMIALAMAVMQHHRPVGVGGGEELISLEILFGMVLMSAWRFLHSVNTPRL